MKKRKFISNKNKGVSNFIFSKIMIVFLLIMIFFIVQGVYSLFQKNSIADQKLEQQRIESNRTQTRYNKVNEELELLRTDFGKEKLLRDKYNISKPGEEVIHIVGEKNERKLEVKEDKSFMRQTYETISSWFN